MPCWSVSTSVGSNVFDGIRVRDDQLQYSKIPVVAWNFTLPLSEVKHWFILLVPFFIRWFQNSLISSSSVFRIWAESLFWLLVDFSDSSVWSNFANEKVWLLFALWLEAWVSRFVNKKHKSVIPRITCNSFCFIFLNKKSKNLNFDVVFL